MKTFQPLRVRSLRALMLLLSAALGAALVAAPVLAEDPSGSAASVARYQADVAACKVASSGTDKAACLQEAGAVRASSGHLLAAPDPVDWERNAVRRCEPLSGADRSDCMARIGGGDGTSVTSGSVAAGGVIRETVTHEIILPIEVPAAKRGASGVQ